MKNLKFPKNHKVLLHLLPSNHYITALENDRSKYYLWSVSEEGKIEKIATATTPTALEKKVKKYNE